MVKMNHRNQVVFGLILFVSFAAFMLFGLSFRGLEKGQKDPQVGKKAQDFLVVSLTDPDQAYNLQSFAGKNWILNFWASWCGSCRGEAQELEAFYQKHQNIPILGVAVQDQQSQALDFAKKSGKSYLLALDRDGKISINYGITGVPETFFIDKIGMIKHRHTGPLTIDDLEFLVREKFKDE